MVQIIPAAHKKKETDWAGLLVGAGQIAQGAYQQYKEKKSNEEFDKHYFEMTGNRLPKNMDPKLKQMEYADALKGKRQEERFKNLTGILGMEKNNSMLPDGQGMSNTNPAQTERNQFNPAEIPDEVIAQIAIEDHQTARVLQSQKNVALREGRAEREFEFQQHKASPEYQREQHLQSAQAQADVKYNQSLEEASKQHALKEQTLSRLEQLNKKGVTGKPYEKLLEKAGLVNLTSEGRREFAADVKNLITDIRSILGAQFTGFEFQTILNAYPNADFSKEANEAIIRNLKDFQDIKSKEVEFAREIKRENGGKLPEDFQSKVNEKVHNYAMSKLPSIKQNTIEIMNNEYKIPKGNTLMFDDRGEPLNVPNDQITRYLELGASLP